MQSFCEAAVDGADVDSVGRSISLFFTSGDASIDRTNFSSDTGLMCSTQHELCAGSMLTSSGRALGMEGADGMSSSSSDDADSTLDASEGTFCAAATALGLSASEHRRRGDCDCLALQQKVSRFHNRQLRFSNRFPFSIACDVLDNMDH